MEPAGHLTRRRVVLLGRLMATLLALTLMLSCFTERGGRASREVPEAGVSASTSAASTEPEKRTLRWACRPESRLRAITDPLVYPSRLTLRQVLVRGYKDMSDVRVQSNNGGLAFVLVRGEERRIERRLRYERSATVGWHVEVVKFCRQRSHR